jgi:hypothetical protein
LTVQARRPRDPARTACSPYCRRGGCVVCSSQRDRGGSGSRRAVVVKEAAGCGGARAFRALVGSCSPGAIVEGARQVAERAPANLLPQVAKEVSAHAGARRGRGQGTQPRILTYGRRWVRGRTMNQSAQYCMRPTPPSRITGGPLRCCLFTLMYHHHHHRPHDVRRSLLPTAVALSQLFGAPTAFSRCVSPRDGGLTQSRRDTCADARSGKACQKQAACGDHGPARPCQRASHSKRRIVASVPSPTLILRLELCHGGLAWWIHMRLYTYMHTRSVPTAERRAQESARAVHSLRGD